MLPLSRQKMTVHKVVELYVSWGYKKFPTKYDISLPIQMTDQCCWTLAYTVIMRAISGSQVISKLPKSPAVVLQRSQTEDDAHSSFVIVLALWGIPDYYKNRSRFSHDGMLENENKKWKIRMATLQLESFNEVGVGFLMGCIISLVRQLVCPLC